MSFEDLPRDWTQRPVTDPSITADVLDLVVRDADRETGAVAALMCNTAERLVQPVVMALPHAGIEVGEHRRFFDVVCNGIVAACGEGDRGGILVAVARRNGWSVIGDDRQGHDAARRSCAEHDVPLLGFWLVTRDVVRRIDDTGSAQSRSA
jgi:hypothetical protein